MNERKRKASRKKMCLSYGLISNVCDKRIHKAFLWNNFSDFSKSDNSLSIAALSYFKWIVISFTAQRFSMCLCVSLCVFVGVILEIRSFKRIRDDLFSCCCVLLLLLLAAAWYCSFGTACQPIRFVSLYRSLFSVLCLISSTIFRFSYIINATLAIRNRSIFRLFFLSSTIKEPIFSVYVDCWSL